MTLTIGRCGLDSPSTESIQTEEVTFDGGDLSIGGTLISTTEAGVLALRQQLLGLADSPDEPVVPIVHAGDPTVTGFYRVKSISVASPFQGVMQAQAALRWAGEFERIAGFGSPQIETIASFPLLTNGVGVTGAEVQGLTANDLWFPSSASELGVGFLPGTTRTGDNGVVRRLASLLTPPVVQTTQWSVPAAHYYDSAVALQVGSSFRTFIGRQLEQSVLSSDLDDWRINNGLVRVSWDTTDDTLVVQHYDGTTWETAKKYKFWLTGVSTDLVDGLVAVRVLANTPDRVTVRLALTSTTFPDPRFSADLTVLRGERMVRITFEATMSTITWAIARATNEAGTATSSSSPFSAAAGIRASANDAGGNRYIIACSALSAKETTIGGLAVSNQAAEALFMVSSEIGGSSAAAHDTASQQILSFLAGTNLQQIVSVR